MGRSCLKRRRIQQRRRARLLWDYGLCIVCKAETDFRGMRCRRCAAKNAMYARERRKRLRETTPPMTEAQ